MSWKRIKKGTVTRDTLREAVYEAVAGVSRIDAVRFVDHVLDEIIEALVNEEEVKLHEFGVFKVRHKRERIARNVKTGGTATVTARRVVTFKPSIIMLNMLARTEADSESDKLMPPAIQDKNIFNTESRDGDQKHYSDEDASIY